MRQKEGQIASVNSHSRRHCCLSHLVGNMLYLPQPPSPSPCSPLPITQEKSPQSLPPCCHAVAVSALYAAVAVSPPSLCSRAAVVQRGRLIGPAICILSSETIIVVQDNNFSSVKGKIIEDDKCLMCAEYANGKKSGKGNTDPLSGSDSHDPWSG